MAKPKKFYGFRIYRGKIHIATRAKKPHLYLCGLETHFNRGHWFNLPPVDRRCAIDPDDLCKSCAKKMEKPQWEIDHGITADRFEDHHNYYLQKAAAFGIGWPADEDKFMYRTREQWAVLYEEDEHLNNVPLREFDQHHVFHRAVAQRFRIPIATADTVCMLKAVIREEVRKWRRNHIASKNSQTSDAKTADVD